MPARNRRQRTHPGIRSRNREGIPRRRTLRSFVSWNPPGTLLTGTVTTPEQRPRQAGEERPRAGAVPRSLYAPAGRSTMTFELPRPVARLDSLGSPLTDRTSSSQDETPVGHLTGVP